MAAPPRQTGAAAGAPARTASVRGASTARGTRGMSPSSTSAPSQSLGRLAIPAFSDAASPSAQRAHAMIRTRGSAARAASATLAPSAPVTTVTPAAGAAKAVSTAQATSGRPRQSAVSLPPPKRDPAPAASTSASTPPSASIPSRPYSAGKDYRARMAPYDPGLVDATAAAPLSGLADGFGRRIRYLRVSVTDRCDLRCVYCMPERMRFLPRAEVLSLEELDRLCSLFVAQGVRKLRLTGGEPLVRRGVMDLVRSLSRHLATGALDELTLTTNGTRLAEFAGALAAAGVRRVNVSLDTLDPARFAALTRGGDLKAVLAGLDAARAAGLQVKLNTVALAQRNWDEWAALVAFAHGQGFDLSFIETMPIGEVDEDRTDQFVPMAEVRAALAAVWTLTPLPDSTGGPSRYVRVAETGGRVGFITPMTHNFCDDCNRVRLTCTGVLHPCLGQEDATDLRAPLRASPGDDAPVLAAIARALAAKPRRHDFVIARQARAAVARHMSTTGG